MLLNFGSISKEKATGLVDGLDVKSERKWNLAEVFLAWAIGRMKFPGTDMRKSIGSAYLKVAGENVMFVSEHKFGNSISPLS